jgi:hypothetical protein
LTLLSRSESSSISKNQINNHNVNCLDLQRKRKSKGSRIKIKGLIPNLLFNSPYWKVKSSLLQRKDLHSSMIDVEEKEYFPGTMNIYVIRNNQAQKRPSGIPWHGLVLHKILNIDDVPLVKYVRWRINARNMDCSHPK